MVFLLPAYFLVFQSPASAHVGHDHGPKLNLVETESSPRAYMQSDQYEIVAIKSDEKLIIFLDDYKTNTPVSGATLDLLVEGELSPIEEIAAGIYAADWIVSAGLKDLAIGVTDQDNVQLLNGSIQVPEPDSSSQKSAREESLFDRTITKQSLIAFLLGGILVYFVLVRRYRNSDDNSNSSNGTNLIKAPRSMDGSDVSESTRTDLEKGKATQTTATSPNARA